MMTNRTYKFIVFIQVGIILAIALIITAGDFILPISNI